MNALWSYFWPMFAAGLIIGAIAGSVAFRFRRAGPQEGFTRERTIIDQPPRARRISVAAGVAASIAAAALWHGPLGAAGRFTGEVERTARATLDYYEMTQVTARLVRAPLTRRLTLSGPADDFQRSELVRIMGNLPGVTSARWSAAGGGVPLIIEGMGANLAGFLLGLLLAYGVARRRRFNAQWGW